MLRSKLLNRAVFVLAVLHALGQLCVWLPHHWVRTGADRDMVEYYWAASRIAHGLSPYWTDPSYGPDRFPSQYLYSPQFAALIAPGGHMSFPLFSKIWYLFDLAAFWAFAFTLAALSGRRTLAHTLIWGLVLGMTPGVYRALSIGQVDPMLWALFGLALLVPRLRWLLAFSCQVKPYAVYPLVIAAWRERRIVLPSAAVLILGFGFGLAALGLRSFHEWLSVTTATAAQGTFDSINISLSMLVLRIARWTGLWHYHTGPLPAGPRHLLSVLAFAGPLLTIWPFRKLDTERLCAASAVAAMLWSPICWYYYPVIAFAFVAVTLRHWTEAQHTDAVPEAVPAAL